MLCVLEGLFTNYRNRVLRMKSSMCTFQLTMNIVYAFQHRLWFQTDDVIIKWRIVGTDVDFDYLLCLLDWPDD